jgi:hypothetical protein
MSNRFSTQHQPQEGEHMEEEVKASREMPKYRSHKTVWALKIKSVEHDSDAAAREGRDATGNARITPEDPGYAPFDVDAAYVRKHDPKAGGYFVAYEDGYLSFSPAEAFEAGYTRIP